MCGIYKVTNKVNGKSYIGQSVDIERRWRKHRSGPFSPANNQYDSYFYRAIRKYGIGNFVFSVIEECPKELLNQREIYWIAQYDTSNCENGYNSTNGGSSATVTTLTLDQVKKIRCLLQTTDMSQIDIAKQFGVDQRSISYINTGQTWLDSSLSYPLRSRSRKLQPVCEKCGKPVSHNGNMCMSCAQLLRQNNEHPSREQLKQDIRIMPFLAVGRKYGVSDNSIRKWCKKENLPTQAKIIKTISDEDWSKI